LQLVAAVLGIDGGGVVVAAIDDARSGAAGGNVVGRAGGGLRFIGELLSGAGIRPGVLHGDCHWGWVWERHFVAGVSAIRRVGIGELSDVSLTEYGTDHRLLDELRERAPGTWNHTLNVADLARQAAGAIGARALFCHTAALFHDIGKLQRPEIFAENIQGPSPHDEMDPRESARLIIEHVSHGVELARKHRLPRPFRSIILEHHGNSLVRFFYAKAVQLGRGGRIGGAESEFRYAGPPPSTKESGIIAMADAVEAATRSMGDAQPAEIREVVRNLIAERVADGEYAACPLTLADLGQIEASFQAWLAARCHKRPAYPQVEAVP
jgi:cyclic-di-AMP phosphodiesterase PgpH